MPSLDSDHLDLAGLARRGARLCGRLALAELERLAGQARPGAEVGYELAFEPDPAGRIEVRGRVRTRLELRCQRCLGWVVWQIDEPLALTYAPPGVEGEPPAGGELIALAPGQGVALRDLIEDEVLLALPAAPRHQAGTGCQIPARYRAPAAARRPTTRPLGALGALLRH